MKLFEKAFIGAQYCALTVVKKNSWQNNFPFDVLRDIAETLGARSVDGEPGGGPPWQPSRVSNHRRGTTEAWGLDLTSQARFNRIDVELQEVVASKLV